MRTVSLGIMLEQLEGLLETSDLTDWENGFITDQCRRYCAAGRKTSVLTDRQVEKIEQIYRRHFA